MTKLSGISCLLSVLALIRKIYQILHSNVGSLDFFFVLTRTAVHKFVHVFIIYVYIYRFTKSSNLLICLSVLIKLINNINVYLLKAAFTVMN